MAICYVKNVIKPISKMSKTMTTKMKLADFFTDEQLKKLGVKRNTNNKKSTNDKHKGHRRDTLGR